MEEFLWRRNYRGLQEHLKTSGRYLAPRRYPGDTQEHPGRIQDAIRRQLRDTQETPRQPRHTQRHPEGTQGHPGDSKRTRGGWKQHVLKTLCLTIKRGTANLVA